MPEHLSDTWGEHEGGSGSHGAAVVIDKFTERNLQENCSALGDFSVGGQMVMAGVVLELREEMPTLTQFLLSVPTVSWVTLP